MYALKMNCCSMQVVSIIQNTLSLLFSQANICKKRKNRMRSDIAAAIALNRSQSSQLNKDTELLVDDEVEVVLDERTTL